MDARDSREERAVGGLLRARGRGQKDGEEKVARGSWRRGR